MANKSKRRKLLLLLLLHRRRKSTRIGLKSHWVREIFRSRTALGECHALIQETRLVDHTSFYKYFHMSPMKFDGLLSYIGPVITRKVNRMRRPISLEIIGNSISYSNCWIFIFAWAFCCGWNLFKVSNTILPKENSLSLLVS